MPYNMGTTRLVSEQYTMRLVSEVYAYRACAGPAAVCVPARCDDWDCRLPVRHGIVSCDAQKPPVLAASATH